MSFIITNVSGKPLDAGGGVMIPPGKPLRVEKLTDAMFELLKAKALRIMDAEETLEERRADIAAYHPLKIGDPAIDGPKK